MEKKIKPNQHAYAMVDRLLEKNKMKLSVVNDCDDKKFKLAIVFNTMDEKTGLDDMTHDKIRDLLLSLIDDRRWV